MPVVRPEGMPSGDGREALLPPAPPADAPLPSDAVAIIDAVSESAPPSSIHFPSMVPEGMRDTSVTPITSPGFDVGTGARDRPVLLRTDGPEAGKIRSIKSGSARIGRHPATDISVLDPGISRVHARLFKLGDTYHIEDLGSRNGTFVNGARVVECSLQHGQTVRLGSGVSYRFMVIDEKQEELLQRLYESSRRDALTGIFNRQHFEECLRSEMAYARRHQTGVGLLLFDLDFFKVVNDTYGHPTGDAVLRHVTALVSRKLRTEDLFARVGGEEFAVIVRGTQLRRLARDGERLRVAVSTSPAHVEGRQIPISISVGCATSECTASPTGQSLVNLADQRLYRAKQTGRNRVVFDDE
jgi:two-component system cell cycle response regulator